jgi:cob(I)alamin adenosyltransferase
MMTQGNDSDFLTMTSRDQCAMINRAFGLDSRRFVRLPSRNQNSMNYLLNQVPDDIAESESEDAMILKRELTEALEEESNIKALIEQLPPPSNARLLPGRVPGCREAYIRTIFRREERHRGDYQQDSDQDRHNL